MITEKSVLENLSPANALELLQKGNQRYVETALSGVDLNDLREKSTHGQLPHSIVLSCIDSRVPVETIFDCSVGDIFVSRLAGNIINEDVLAGMEYACAVVGTKAIVVMAHESCGAVKAACSKVRLGNITTTLVRIDESIEQYEKEHNVTVDESHTNEVAKKNVEVAIEQIRAKSPILKDLLDEGKIEVYGAFYNLGTGKVDWL